MRVLVLQHIACEHPGVEVMRERGAEPVAVELDRGDPLPDWRDFDGVLAMGGPMGAGDDAEHKWLAAERRLVAEAVTAGLPFLGARLGVQLLAAALGARVYEAERAEVGLLEVELTAEGRDDPLFAGFDERFLSLQWHGDTFDLPPAPRRSRARHSRRTRRSAPASAHTAVKFHLEVTARWRARLGEVPASTARFARPWARSAGARPVADVEAPGRRAATRAPGGVASRPRHRASAAPRATRCTFLSNPPIPDTVGTTVLTREEETRWQRSSACSTTTRSRAIRPSTRATRSRRSPAIPTARRRRRRTRSTSPPASCWRRLRRARPAQGPRDRGPNPIVTSDKDGDDSELERKLADAEVVISQPFWPAYMTAERIAKAPNLKLIITAGIGSDHTDLAGRDGARASRSPRSPTATRSASPSTS